MISSGLLLVTLTLFTQDDSIPTSDQITKLIELLGHPTVGTRDSAERELKKLPYIQCDVLQHHLKATQDGEVVLRLKHVLSHITTRKANRLYQAGQLRKALLALVEPSDPLDREGLVSNRLKEVEQKVYSWFPSDHISDPSMSYKEVAKRIRPHGFWGLAVLADMFRNTESDYWRHYQARKTLLVMGKHAAPAILEALRDKTPRIRAAACAVLYEVGNDSEVIVSALKKSHTNSDEVPKVRLRASDALFELTGSRP